MLPAQCGDLVRKGGQVVEMVRFWKKIQPERSGLCPQLSRDGKVMILEEKAKADFSESQKL